MVSEKVAAGEQRRLRALAEYGIMDTPETEDFSRLAHLAARIFEVPTVLISLVDRDRQFFKARVGVDICETSRDVSFCAHAILRDEILFIPDALRDQRFYSNPLVVGPPFIRFYAGKPLTTPSGERLGTVCLIDSVPRDTFTEEDRRNLSDIAALVMDRMESNRLQHAQSVSQARFENIAATSPDAIICSNTEGHITFWNRSAERLFGYLAEDVLGKPSLVIVPESWRPIYYAELDRLERGEKMELADHTIELSGLRSDGVEFPAEFSLSTWQEGTTVSIGAIVRDITERRMSEERLFRMASIDALTDLPNRAAWRTLVTERLSAGDPVTVLLLDLDGFKEVNDTFGHLTGDAVLKAVADRLQEDSVISPMLVARLGGDEFVILLAGNDSRIAEVLATRLVATLARPFDFAGQSIELGASIGIAMAPQHSTRPDELLGAADLALYKAKAAGKGRYEFFAPAFREVAVARRAFERELRVAFENGEFELFYQPQVAISTGEVMGAEALMRWHHPSRGLLFPASFMDVLGEKPIAAAVGEWSLRTACAAAVQWQETVPNFRIGVNLFEAQLRSNHLPGVLEDILEQTGLSARSLELELVENIVLRKDFGTPAVLRRLRAMGVGLAFDDYGTGYASLSLLKDYPVTRLKIDKSFIRDVASGRADAAVVKAIIYLGRSFGLRVIAEGVETQAQLDFLAERQCEEAQGYLFGEAVAADNFGPRFLNVRDRPIHGGLKHNL